MTGRWAACMLGWVLGTALQLTQPALWSTASYACVALWVLLVWRWRHPLVWLMAGLALAFALTGLRAVGFMATALAPELEGRRVAVTGVVASLPQVRPDGQGFVLAVESAQIDGAAVRLPPRLWLSWYPSRHESAREPALSPPMPTLHAGERWTFEVRLKRPHGPFNPHGFDRERWLWEQGLQATGHVRAGPRDPVPRRLDSTWAYPIDRLRQALRDRISERVGDARTAGVLAALVVGDQAAIDRGDWDLFRDTGVAHLMAISGLHVTLFAWLATALVGRVWRALGRHWPSVLMRWPVSLAAAWGGVTLALAYALLAGWGVPAQRTVLMLVVVVGLRLSARHWPWPSIWLTAMAAVLLLDPWAWLSPGFWLSFVAVAILFASGSAPESRPSEAPVGPWGWAAPAWRLVREQGRITLALAPLSLFLFGQLSAVAWGANLLAIPWVTYVVTPLALLGVGVPALWDIAAWAMQLLVQVLTWMAAVPWAVVHRPVMPLTLSVCAAAGAWLLVMRWPSVWRGAGALLLLPALFWQPMRPGVGDFDVLALDVGQGSAVLVRTAGHGLLVDTGPRWGDRSDAGERIVLPQLRAWGEVPDAVVVTHRDSDHAGGADAIAAAYPDARWLSSFDPDPARRCRAGQTWTWDGVRFEVLHPAESHYRADGSATLSSNDMSCVLRIAGQGEHASAWLAGDLTSVQETRLALLRPHERAGLLLAPHHGSRSSSSPVLLNTLQPRWVVVQAGYRNPFGHPADEVVQRYDQRQIPWVQTPDCGAVRWHSAQPERIRCTRREARRYWHHPGEGALPRSGPVLAILPAGEKRP